jgi:iron complex transport system permease protein|tara:strand:+ start:8957 stop:9967 length:1011 start_codon:yes stop_codon:yes gene_type:complete
MIKLLDPRQKVTISILICVSTFVCFLGLSLGSFNVELNKILSGDADPLQTEVLFNIRLPRVLLAACVGGALGISGAALQGLFRNPLADPGLIGVSAGAAFGAVSAIVLVNSGLIFLQLGSFLVPLAAILGSLLVISLIYILTASFANSGIMYMLLVGIALNAMSTVGIGFLTFVSSDSQLRTLTFWMMGSFGSTSWELLIPSMVLVFITILTLVLNSRKLDIMQLGESEAYRTGVDVLRTRRTIILSSAIMIGTCVSLSGIIGFVGLVVPHIVRLLAGSSHTFLLIGSAIMGTLITVLADLFSRLIIQPAELPIGLATSAIGAPFFLWLVLRLRNK